MTELNNEIRESQRRRYAKQNDRSDNGSFGRPFIGRRTHASGNADADQSTHEMI